MTNIATGRSGFGALLYVSDKSVRLLPDVPAVASGLVSSGEPNETVNVGPGTNNESFNWRKLAGITDFDGPGLETTEIDITTHDTEGGYMAYAPGLKEPGEYSFDVVFDPSADSHDRQNPYSFPALFDTQETRWWTATMSNDPNTTDEERNNQQFTFKGYVKSFENQITLNDVIKASVTIKISAKIYFSFEDRS